MFKKSNLITAGNKSSFFLQFWHKNKIGYFFLLPWFIGLFGFTLFPIVVSLYLSFTNYDFFHTPQWIGLSNFVDMFKYDSRYIQSLKVTFTYVFIPVPLQLIFALLLAMILDKGLPGLSLFRAIYYLPSLLGGSVAIGILWRQFFGLKGIFNTFLTPFGIQEVSWIGNPKYAIYTLILLRVWQFGSSMIIFLAGLRQVPKELYEAASIDGAKKSRVFFNITLPLLTPVIFFNLIMQIISSMQSFTPAFIIGGSTGGPGDTLLFYTVYLYLTGFKYFEMGYASGMAWILLFIIAFFTLIIFLTSFKWVYYES